MRNLTVGEVGSLLGWSDIGDCPPQQLPSMTGIGGNVCLYEPTPAKMAGGVQDPSIITNVVVEGSLGSQGDCAQDVPFLPEGSSYSLEWEVLSVGKSWNGNPYYNYGFSGIVKTGLA